MQKLILLLIFSITLNALEILEIKDDFKSVSGSDYMYYMKDQNRTLKASDILKKENLKKVPKGGQMKPSFGPFWSKLKIKNSSQKVQNLILYNKVPGINYIDVFIYKDKKLKTSYLLGDMREQDNKKYLNRYSLFELTLLANEEITIVSKVENFNINNISWFIQTPSIFLNEESKTLIILGIAGGFFLLFLLLNTILFTIYRTVTYLIIALHTLMSFLYMFSINGILYHIDIELNLDFITAIAWVAPMFGTILLLLFPYYYFNMKENYFKTSIVIRILIFLNLLFVFFHIYGFYYEPFYLTIAMLAGLVIGVTTIVLFLIGLYVKEIGSKYYLLGQLILLIAVTLNSLAIFGVIPYNENYRYMVTVAVSLDMILLLIAQYQKTQHNIKNLKDNKEMLINQSHLTSIGQAIEHIVHQWKTPLTQIGTSVTLIETSMHHDKKNLNKNLEIQIPKISMFLSLMKKTIDEFSNYYSKNMKKEFFEVKKIIYDIENLFRSKIILKNAKVIVNIDNGATCKFNPSKLANIL